MVNPSPFPTSRETTERPVMAAVPFHRKSVFPWPPFPTRPFFSHIHVMAKSPFSFPPFLRAAGSSPHVKVVAFFIGWLPTGGSFFLEQQSKPLSVGEGIGLKPSFRFPLARPNSLSGSGPPCSTHPHPVQMKRSFFLGPNF